MAILLVNPMQKIYTKDIFQKYDQKKIVSAQIQTDWRKKISPKQQFIKMIKNQKNDLYQIAVEQNPILKDINDSLEKINASIITGMSGSGATCFALFDNMKKAQNAKIEIQKQFTSFWVKSARIIS